MSNVADTPTSGEFLEADDEGRRIVEALREHLDALASASRSLEGRSRGLGGVPLFRLMAGSVGFLRSLHDTAGQYIRALEKYSGGSDAITIRDLQAAPGPVRRRSGRKVGIAISSSIAAIGAGVYTGSEMGVLPQWARAIGFLLGLLGGGAMPAFVPWERERKD